jgi:hypothetical protein
MRDNIWFQLEENPLSCVSDLEELEAVARSFGKHDAADELLRYALKIETFKRRLDVYYEHYRRLVQVAEKVARYDYGPDAFDVSMGEMEEDVNLK